MLAACAARRWLARNAAGVNLIYTDAAAKASACTSLVSCLPALEDVMLCLIGPLFRDDLACLLEALAGCPRLRALTLFSEDAKHVGHTEDEDLHWPFPDAAAFAKLRSLTQLELAVEVKTSLSWLT